MIQLAGILLLLLTPSAGDNVTRISPGRELEYRAAHPCPKCLLVFPCRDFQEIGSPVGGSQFKRCLRCGIDRFSHGKVKIQDCKTCGGTGTIGPKDSQ